MCLIKKHNHYSDQFLNLVSTSNIYRVFILPSENTVSFFAVTGCLFSESANIAKIETSIWNLSFSLLLKAALFTIEYGEIEVTDILQDDLFSDNHEVEKIETVEFPIEEGALIIATVDDPKQNVFTLEKVGVI
ncbi:hypothetical protein EfmAA242_09560 [Enterococcus faecium]|nr:hypothetical protein EfmAA242_09560 [Enterococcus faecium]